jgi:hypothetical protein
MRFIQRIAFDWFVQLRYAFIREASPPSVTVMPQCPNLNERSNVPEAIPLSLKRLIKRNNFFLNLHGYPLLTCLLCVLLPIQYHHLQTLDTIADPHLFALLLLEIFPVRALAEHLYHRQ